MIMNDLRICGLHTSMIYCTLCYLFLSLSLSLSLTLTKNQQSHIIIAHELFPGLFASIVSVFLVGVSSCMIKKTVSVGSFKDYGGALLMFVLIARAMVMINHSFSEIAVLYPSKVSSMQSIVSVLVSYTSARPVKVV